MQIKTVYEPHLLGTAGTLLANREFFDESTVMLIHADNATSADLTAFLEAHYSKQNDCLLTMLIFSSTRPSTCGIVEIDSDGVVTSFHEKVANPPGNNANGAVYLFDSSLLDWIESNCGYINDFSTDVLPRLITRIKTWKTDAPYIDIGTYEGLSEANSIFQND